MSCFSERLCPVEWKRQQSESNYDGEDMNYETKRALECVFESYLSALETKDTQTMKTLWKQGPSSRIHSIFGMYEGSAIFDELMDQIYGHAVAALHVCSYQLEVLELNEKTAMVQTRYEIVLAMNDEEKSARNQYILETQLYEKEDGNWKLAYVHQSKEVPHIAVKPQVRLNSAIDGMLRWLMEQNGSTRGIPRSMRDKKDLLKSLLKDFDGSLQEEYIASQEIFLEESRRDKHMEVIPFLLDESERCRIWQGDPTNLAVDGIISFLPENESYDPLLSMEAGIELQCDIREIMTIKPRSLISLSGYHLFAKGIIEIMVMPVYGLLTKARQRQILQLFRQALLEAQDQHYTSLAVTINWKEQLHLPLAFFEQMAEVLQSEIRHFSAVVFCVSRSDERRAMEQVIEQIKPVLIGNDPKDPDEQNQSIPVAQPSLSAKDPV